MSVTTDSLRSERWRSFAKQKLQMLKDVGLQAKSYVIRGYRIKLLTIDAIEKAEITAPPVGLVAHIEHPPGDFGSENLYYAEPYGAGAGVVGQVGNSVDGVYQVVRTLSGTDKDAPGAGVIFPTKSQDVYHISTGLWAYGDGVAQSLAFLETKFAEAAAKDLSGATELIGLGSTSTSVGGWQVGGGDAVFAVYFNMDGTTSNQVYVFAHGLNYRANVILDMDSAEVQGLIGDPNKHLSIRSAYIYMHAGKARLAVFAAPVDPADNLGGVYFFDFVLSATRELTWSYAGRCLTGVLGGAWVLDTPLVKVGGPVITSESQEWKSCVFADGSGGVRSIIRQPGDTSSTAGSYSFTPAAATRTPGEFPEGISDPQTWATIYIGSNGYLCVLEKIYDDGDGPLNSVVALYSGDPESWTALPMPAETILAVRPVQIDSDISLLAVVWGGSGTYMAEFGAAGWLLRGKFSDGRMVRPVVGVFGHHRYARLALGFPGSFPVTSWAGTNNYTGG